MQKCKECGGKLPEDTFKMGIMDNEMTFVFKNTCLECGAENDLSVNTSDLENHGLI
jgi:NAD-dependent dihydropyrimidine dehydrogenase PreA subunit